MAKLTEVKKFDVRSLERNIKYGIVTRADVDQYLDSLPDVSAKAVTLGEIEDRRLEIESRR